MPSKRRLFRIESMGEGGLHAGGAGRAQVAGHFERILAELADLRHVMQRLENREVAAPQPSDAQTLWAELESIQLSIQRTKHEIATLKDQGFQGEPINRVADELDAVVSGTEQATETILSAAEAINDTADQLMAVVGDAGGELVSRIQEQVITIFEACNFQDLTGQRISKVVTTLQFIEQRVANMMEIWGGRDGFPDVTAPAQPAREGDRALLNGPPRAGDVNVVSQNDIDVLFA